MSLEKILYTGTATSTGGREGRSSTSDGKLDLALSTPRELGGAGGEGTNPEQLFAAGYSACFQGALGVVARQEGADVSGSTVTARVGIGKNDDGFGIIVEIEAEIPDMDAADARALLEKAHQVCPYSKATRGNISVTLL